MNVSAADHEKAVNIVNETLAQARSIWPSKAHLIHQLFVSWCVTRAGVAGTAYMGRGKIGLNPDYIGQEDFWGNTIKHEVAHHLQRWLYPTAKQAHGPEFRHIMRVLGGSTATHHKMETERLKEKKENCIDYYCPHCKQEFQVSPLIHRRMQSGKGRSCTKCVRIRGSKNTMVIVRVGENPIEKVTIENKKIELTNTPKKVHGPASLKDLFPSLF